MTTPEYLTTAEVAERLKVPVSTLNRWVAEDRIAPAFSAPGPKGARFFDPADVDQLVEERRSELLAILPEPAAAS